MSEHKLTRKDVDKLAATILINFGLINAAALGASLAQIKGFNSTPFCIGLIAAIFSQIMWYFDASLEYAFNNKLFSKVWERDVANIISTLLIIGAGAISGSCIVYGCFKFMTFSHSDSLLYAFLMCVLPIIALIYITIRKPLEDTA